MMSIPCNFPLVKMTFRFPIASGNENLGCFWVVSITQAALHCLFGWMPMDNNYGYLSEHPKLQTIVGEKKEIIVNTMIEIIIINIE